MLQTPIRTPTSFAFPSASINRSFGSGSHAREATHLLYIGLSGPVDRALIWRSILSFRLFIRSVYGCLSEPLRRRPPGEFLS